jgi:hypothetical protein
MKIELDGKVYSYILTKIEDLKSRVDGLGIKLANFGLSIGVHNIDASLDGTQLYDSVFDEISSIKGHLDDLHHILTGGRVE